MVDSVTIENQERNGGDDVKDDGDVLSREGVTNARMNSIGLSVNLIVLCQIIIMKFHMDGGLKEQSAVETEMTRMGDNGWWLSMVVLGGYVSAYCWSMFEEYTNPTTNIM